jgi:GAF domain-containing protein
MRTFLARFFPEQSSQDRSTPLKNIGSEISRSLFLRLEPDVFLKNVAERIRQEYDAVHQVQIYLIEPGSQRASLHASSGSAGDEVSAQEYRLDVGGLSVVGRVTLTGQPLLIPDISRDLVHQSRASSSDVHCVLALPMLAGEKVIGAVEIASARAGAFDQADVAAFEVITSLLTLAVDNSQWYEAAQRSARENEALRQQTQASLREIERLNYQLTGRAWADYLRLHADSAALTLDLESGDISSEAQWTATLSQAATQRDVIASVDDGRRVVALPIVVRNETIGAMEFELEADDDLPDGALELVAAVGQRLGLAMENRRLFDETQRIAHREALINDIGTELLSATGVDAIIQQAARHLQEALSAQQVTIRLGSGDQRIQEKTGS